MIKRFLYALIISCLVIIPAGSTAVAAEENTIWQGLWNGVNLTFGSQDSAQAIQPTASARTSYAALGDSVAAGLGLTPGATCGRSSSAYPYVVAQKLDLKLTHLACSGATAGDMVTKQRVDGPNIPAQLPAAFASGKPKLITITAGANDAHWDDFIRSCYAFDCTGESSTLAANAFLVSLQLKLLYAFSDIQVRSRGTPPQVIITGYYNPLSNRCAAQQSNITASEIAWLDAEVSALNQTIKDVADLYSFVEFAPVNFKGHDICSDKPWVQGVNAAAPFHPTVKGQKVIADAVIAAYRR